LDSFELENRIRELVEAAGFRLLQAFWKPIRGRHQLRVVTDAEDHNITIDECANLTRAIRDFLDSYPHEFPDYRLEVSSPGLNHPLAPWQYRKNIGRTVAVQYHEEDAVRTWQGELVAVQGDSLTVRQGEETREFGADVIRQVLVLPPF